MFLLGNNQFKLHSSTPCITLIHRPSVPVFGERRCQETAGEQTTYARHCSTFTNLLHFILLFHQSIRVLYTGGQKSTMFLLRNVYGMIQFLFDNSFLVDIFFSSLLKCFCCARQALVTDVLSHLIAKQPLDFFFVLVAERTNDLLLRSEFDNLCHH